jgi:hypothetical protein
VLSNEATRSVCRDVEAIRVGLVAGKAGMGFSNHPVVTATIVRKDGLFEGSRGVPIFSLGSQSAKGNSVN